MRGCDTAIIHVGTDGLRFDGACNEEPRISSDVLIEIGAAMALYGRTFTTVETRVSPDLRWLRAPRFGSDSGKGKPDLSSRVCHGANSCLRYDATRFRARTVAASRPEPACGTQWGKQ
jgi:hypothetical protein